MGASVPVFVLHCFLACALVAGANAPPLRRVLASAFVFARR
nr:MAG TPA: hypothetical protein [Bacteriophage sp.]DAO45224.1 MAG TPA: hypothetical protein [Caudoviricetes sp.]DAR07967.1 MAG TPA: hypothetical protein [Caudoviricetes sp.]